MNAQIVDAYDGVLILAPRNEHLLLVAVRDSVGIDVSVDPLSLFKELAQIVGKHPRLFFERRGEETVEVPPIDAIVDAIHAIRALLVNAPRAVKDVDENGRPFYVWSPYEEEAARKAAILLDVVAMLLRNPEQMLRHLPEDVNLLIKRHKDLKSYIEGGSDAGDRSA